MARELHFDSQFFYFSFSVQLLQFSKVSTNMLWLPINFGKHVVNPLIKWLGKHGIKSSEDKWRDGILEIRGYECGSYGCSDRNISNSCYVIGSGNKVGVFTDFKDRLVPSLDLNAGEGFKVTDIMVYGDREW